jgi:hypothetical protein
MCPQEASREAEDRAVVFKYAAVGGKVPHFAKIEIAKAPKGNSEVAKDRGWCWEDVREIPG